MTQQTAHPAAPSKADWPILAAIGFAALVVLGIASMLVITYRQDSRTRDYVNSHPWTRDCQERLRAATTPLLQDSIIADHCRHAARYGGAPYAERIATLSLLEKDRKQLESIKPYLHRENQIPGCGRWKCAPPP